MTAHHAYREPPVSVPGAGAVVGPRLAPNPLRAGFTLCIAGLAPSARLQLFDVAGRLLRVMRTDVALITWDGRAGGDRPAGPGVYFLRVTTGDRIATTRGANVD